MKIKAEDTAALIIDFQEKLVPAIADHDEIVAKAAIFAAGLKEFGVPMAVTQQYTKGLGETVPAMKEAIGAFEPMEKTVFSAMGCDAFVEWVKAQGKKTILVCGVEAHICVLQSICALLGMRHRNVRHDYNIRTVLADTLYDVMGIIGFYRSVCLQRLAAHDDSVFPILRFLGKQIMLLFYKLS